MKKNGKILSVFGYIPVYILLSFVWFILIASLLCRAEYCNYRYNDKPAWVHQDSILLLISVFIMVVILAGLLILSKRLNKYNNRRVLFIIISLSLIVQLSLLLLFPTKQFADQEEVNRISYDIIKGDFEAFRKGGYLYQYPNNIGITLFLSLIYRIFPQPLVVPKLLNIVFSTITSYLIFKIFKVTQPNNQNQYGYGILIFSCFFPPMILLNNLVYNDIFATTLLAAAIYYIIKFTNTRKWYLLAIAGVLLSMGNFLRQVGLVFLLAISIYLIIIRIPIMKTIAFLVVVLILCKLPLFIINTYLIENDKITEPLGSNSIPIHMWIHMGMNEETIGYWDGSYSWRIYTDQCQSNKNESIQVYSKLINDKIQNLGIINLTNVYIEKNLWLWTEGTYQAEYYGIGAWGHLYSTPATIKYDSSVYFRDSIRWILHVINILMLGLIFIGLMYSVYKKKHYPLLLPVIVLLGFIGFYTIWEIKPRYLYPIYPYLILMAYEGLIIFINLLPYRLKSFIKFK